MSHQSVPSRAELVCIDYLVSKLLCFLQASLSFSSFFEDLWLLESYYGLALPDLLVPYHVLLVNLPEDENSYWLSRVPGVKYGNSLL